MMAMKWNANMNEANTVLTPDVLIIGAGPSGAAAASLLRQYGYQVLVLERQHFPRFSIGESLLPQSMAFLEEAGLLDAVNQAAPEFGFQFKNGAAFLRGNERTHFDFTDKFTAGPGTTWQIKRAPFDHVLAKQAAAYGADIRYGHTVTAVDVGGEQALVDVQTEDGATYQVQPKFMLDASGFGRVLPKLLDLESPSNFPLRRAVFTHIADHFDPAEFDRNKILISVHQHHPKAWFWNIPFADGRCSFGVVAETDFYAQFGDLALDDLLPAILASEPSLSKLLARAEFDTPVREIVGYSANVNSLTGRHFDLLGNAGEFLDPVFSSGVTIALKSASLCAPLLHRQLQGGSVDWHNEYEVPLRRGIKVFRAYVEAWYEGSFQDVVFAVKPQDEVKRMVCSLLAGYAWDESNPMNNNSVRRLATLAEICRDGRAQDAQG